MIKSISRASHMRLNAKRKNRNNKKSNREVRFNEIENNRDFESYLIDEINKINSCNN